MRYFITILLLAAAFLKGAQAQQVQAPTRNSNMAPAEVLRFYPNPATTYINFDFQRSYDRTYTLQVYNFMGKKVYEVKNTPPRINFSLEDFYRGVYIYQLRDRNGQIIESGRFQVIK